MTQKKELPSTFKGYINEHSVIVGYPCKKGNDNLPSIVITRKKERDLTPLDIIKALGKSGKTSPKYGHIHPTQYPDKARA